MARITRIAPRQRRVGGLRAVAVFAAVLGLAPAADSAEPESTCVTCHEVDIDTALALPVAEWRESVHAARLVSCDGCHGGDPYLEAEEDSMSPQAGFLPAPAWPQVGDHCGVCHEEIAESHARGRFGLAIAGGVRAPTCTTCHMQEGHRIRPATPEMIAARESCDGCPGVGDPGAAVARLAALRDAEHALRARISFIETRGIELSDLAKQADAVRSELSRSLHAFDDAGLEEAVVLTTGHLDRLAARLAPFEREIAVRRQLGFWLVGALAVLLAALLASRHGSR